MQALGCAMLCGSILTLFIAIFLAKLGIMRKITGQFRESGKKLDTFRNTDI